MSSKHRPRELKAIQKGESEFKSQIQREKQLQVISSEDRELKRIRQIEEMFKRKEREDERKRHLKERRELRKTMLAQGLDLNGDPINNDRSNDATPSKGSRVSKEDKITDYDQGKSQGVNRSLDSTPDGKNPVQKKDGQAPNDDTDNFNFPKTTSGSTGRKIGSHQQMARSKQLGSRGRGRGAGRLKALVQQDKRGVGRPPSSTRKLSRNTIQKKSAHKGRRSLSASSLSQESDSEQSNQKKPSQASLVRKNSKKKVMLSNQSSVNSSSANDNEDDDVLSSSEQESSSKSIKSNQEPVKSQQKEQMKKQIDKPASVLGKRQLKTSQGQTIEKKEDGRTKRAKQLNLLKSQQKRIDQKDEVQENLKVSRQLSIDDSSKVSSKIRAPSIPSKPFVTTTVKPASQQAGGSSIKHHHSNKANSLGDSEQISSQIVTPKGTNDNDQKAQAGKQSGVTKQDGQQAAATVEPTKEKQSDQAIGASKDLKKHAERKNKVEGKSQHQANAQQPSQVGHSKHSNANKSGQTSNNRERDEELLFGKLSASSKQNASQNESQPTSQQNPKPPNTPSSDKFMKQKNKGTQDQTQNQNASKSSQAAANKQQVIDNSSGQRQTQNNNCTENNQSTQQQQTQQKNIIEATKTIQQSSKAKNGHNSSTGVKQQTNPEKQSHSNAAESDRNAGQPVVQKTQPLPQHIHRQAEDVKISKYVQPAPNKSAMPPAVYGCGNLSSLADYKPQTYQELIKSVVQNRNRNMINAYSSMPQLTPQLQRRELELQREHLREVFTALQDFQWLQGVKQIADFL